MEKRGFSFRSILSFSLWITLVGSLLFTLSTTKGHSFGYIKFFSISGTLLATLPWVIQLLVTSTVIVLYKTKGYNLMWIVQTPESKENHPTVVVTTTTSSSSSSPLSSRQVLKIQDVDAIDIRIVAAAGDQRSSKDGSFVKPLVMPMEFEKRNNPKL